MMLRYCALEHAHLNKPVAAAGNVNHSDDFHRFSRKLYFLSWKPDDV